MFVSPFTVSVSCDAAIIVIYLQRTDEFGGSSWFGIEEGHGFTTEVVDLVSCTSERLLWSSTHVGVGVQYRVPGSLAADSFLATLLALPVACFSEVRRRGCVFLVLSGTRSCLVRQSRVSCFRPLHHVAPWGERLRYPAESPYIATNLFTWDSSWQRLAS